MTEGPSVLAYGEGHRYVLGRKKKKQEKKTFPGLDRGMPSEWLMAFFVVGQGLAICQHASQRRARSAPLPTMQRTDHHRRRRRRQPKHDDGAGPRSPIPAPLHIHPYSLKTAGASPFRPISTCTRPCIQPFLLHRRLRYKNIFGNLWKDHIHVTRIAR